MSPKLKVVVIVQRKNALGSDVKQFPIQSVLKAAWTSLAIVFVNILIIQSVSEC